MFICSWRHLLTIPFISSSILKGHLEGIDDDVASRVDGEEEMIDLDEDEEPRGILRLKLPVSNHLSKDDFLVFSVFVAIR